MTILVVWVYWTLVIVTALFLVKFRVSSGYVYGIIYYYSMVGILLSNNAYFSEGVMIFINVISGFAQITPKFLFVGRIK